MRVNCDQVKGGEGGGGRGAQFPLKIKQGQRGPGSFPNPTPSTCPHQSRIQGRGPEGSPPLFLDQTEARRAEKNCFGDRAPHYFGVWMTALPTPSPLCDGLDPKCIPVPRCPLNRITESTVKEGFIQACEQTLHFEW